MIGNFDFTDSRRADLLLALTRRLGFSLSPQHRILDFGCGRGQNVYHLRRKGLRAYGVDVDERSKEADSWCAEFGNEPLFAQARLRPYRLPYEDGAFDFIFSDHVFEHIMDYDSVMREVSRVLAPSGVSLNIFPARLRLLESHIKVPFGGLVTNRGWFTLWANLGIGKAWHNPQLSASEIGKLNADFRHYRVNYLSRRQISSYAKPYFEECDFVENVAVRERLGMDVPGLSSILSTFHVRVMKLASPKKATGSSPNTVARSGTINVREKSESLEARRG